MYVLCDWAQRCSLSAAPPSPKAASVASSVVHTLALRLCSPLVFTGRCCHVGRAGLCLGRQRLWAGGWEQQGRQVQGDVQRGAEAASAGVPRCRLRGQGGGRGRGICPLLRHHMPVQLDAQAPTHTHCLHGRSTTV